MTANELRVGNWVMVKGNIERVEEIWIPRGQSDYKIATNKSFGYWLKDSAEPIRLTKEMLEKLGFERVGDYWNKGLIQLCQICYSPDLNIGYINTLDNEIEFLHQLQNLYFALTGTELEYNPIKETV